MLYAICEDDLLLDAIFAYSDITTTGKDEIKRNEQIQRKIPSHGPFSFYKTMFRALNFSQFMVNVIASQFGTQSFLLGMGSMICDGEMAYYNFKRRGNLMMRVSDDLIAFLNFGVINLLPKK
ncbi:hypothetical protein ACJX0J_028478, partial [Zea mays]